MKFPKATIILVSAALIFVLWQQTRDQSAPIDERRFVNLASNPVERSVVVDWVVTRIPTLCEEAAADTNDGDAVSGCVDRSGARTSACRRAMYERFPAVVATDAVFRDLTITMMNCLVPQSERLN